MITETLGSFASILSATLGHTHGVTVSGGILAYLGLTAGAGMTAACSLHSSELLCRRLLRWGPFDRFASATIEASRMTTAMFVVFLLSGWCVLTGYAAHLLGFDPYWGIPLLTVGWMATNWVIMLTCIPLLLVFGPPRYGIGEAW